MSDLLPSPGHEIVTREDGSTYALPDFRWSVDAEQAAVDLAEGHISITKICDRAGVAYPTLQSWRAHPQFRRRVDEYKQRFRDETLTFGICNQETRLRHLQDTYDALMKVREQRGAWFEQNDETGSALGGGTGLLGRKNTREGPEYKLDAALLSESREILKMAAIMKGEWNEGSAPTVAVQIVCPSTAPDASTINMPTIGSK